MFSGSVAVFGPQSVHLADVAGSSESVDFVLAEIFHQLRELVVGEQRLQLNRLLVGVTSYDFIKGAATMQIVDDIAADAVVVL